MLSNKQPTCHIDPAPSRRTAAAAIIGDVRRLFHQFRALGDAVHADLGLSASMRAVIESLARDGPSTVPQMARARPVSRQHIQTIVDDLVAAGLVELRANPAHKRSPLVGLTSKGAEAFARMSNRQGVLLDRITAGLEDTDIKATLRTLTLLKQNLSALLADCTLSQGDENAS